MDQTVQGKTCQRCKKAYPATADYFYVANRTKGRLSSYCIKCQREAAMESYHRRRKVANPRDLEGRPPKGYKRCSKCHHVLPANRQFFHKNRRNSDNLGSWCKVCKKQNARSRYMRRTKPVDLSGTEALPSRGAYQPVELEDGTVIT